MPEDMVTFLMPDGTQVSNDPRFDLEKARQEMLSARPNRGDIGIDPDEMTAQTQTEHLANLQSGQPGVGPNAAPEDPKEYLPNTGSPAMRIQRDDAKEAQEAGADVTSTSVPDPDPVDSNEQVLEIREAKLRRAEAARRAQEKLGEEGQGDGQLPYSEWSSAQLKAEALRRNAERNEDEQLELEGIRKKSELAALLEKDDGRQQSAATEGSES